MSRKLDKILDGFEAWCYRSPVPVDKPPILNKVQTKREIKDLMLETINKYNIASFGDDFGVQAALDMYKKQLESEIESL